MTEEILLFILVNGILNIVILMTIYTIFKFVDNYNDKKIMEMYVNDTK